MARIEPVAKPGWLVRVAAWMMRRRTGMVPKTLYLQGHHPRILASFLAYMGLLEGTHQLPKSLKRLVHVRVAMRVGCPF